MAITTKTLGQEIDPEQILANVKEVLTDLEDQLNTRAQVYTSTDGKIPTNLNRNDVLISVYKGNISIRIRAAKSYVILTAEMLGGITANNQRLLPQQTAAVNPGLVNFPKVGDFGFFHNTAAPAFYLCVNMNNTIKKVALT